MKETIAEVNKYIDEHFEDSPPNREDFFNIFDGTMTCGKCGKKMRMLRSLFHFHFK